MDLNLSGKTAIVTGGSAGIGLACCKTLYMEGTRIVLAAHEGVDSAAESIRQQADAEYEEGHRETDRRVAPARRERDTGLDDRVAHVCEPVGNAALRSLDHAARPGAAVTQVRRQDAEGLEQ